MGWKSKEAKSEYDRKRYELRKSVKPEKVIPIHLNLFDETPDEPLQKSQIIKGGSFPRFNKRTEYILNRKYPEMVEMNRLKTELLDLEQLPKKESVHIKRPLTFKL
jgi:hypothetical protein